MTEHAVSGVQQDAYRHPLHDLGEVAGGVFRRQHTELRTGGRSQAVESAMELLSDEHVGVNADPLAGHHMRQLILLEVDIHPQSAGRYHREQLRARLGVGAAPCPAIADHTVHRCAQFGVVKVQLRQITFGTCLYQCSPGLLFLGGDDIQLPLGRE